MTRNYFSLAVVMMFSIGAFTTRADYYYGQNSYYTPDYYSVPPPSYRSQPPPDNYSNGGYENYSPEATGPYFRADTGPSFFGDTHLTHFGVPANDPMTFKVGMDVDVAG